MGIWGIVLAVLSVGYAFFWYYFGVHRGASVFLFLPLAAILVRTKENIYPDSGTVMAAFAIATIALFLIFIFTEMEARVLSSLVIGIESAVMTLIGVSLLPFFSHDIIDDILMWLIDGGFKALLIFCWPLALGFVFFVGIFSND